jgi:membrane protease YdiL (CAAX protease family)
METTQMILKYLICFSGFFILSWLAKKNDGNKLMDEKGPVRNSGTLVGLQIGGILWMGLVPFFIFKRSLESVILGNTPLQILPVILFVVLIGTTVFVASNQSKKDFLKTQDKEVVAEVFNSSFVSRYMIARFIFLCVYEIFFRGYMLTDCIDQWGITIGIVINIALYMLIHLFSGKKEIIGCIPFGLALCAVSILFNAVWPAIVLHLALSFTYEISLVNRIRQSLKPVV